MPRRPANQVETEHDRFAARVVTAGSICIAMLALALFLWYSIPVLLLIFAGILIAILLRGLADWVSEYTKLPHAASLAIVLLVLIGSLVALVWAGAPRIAEQVGQMADRLPQGIEDLRQKIASTRVGGMLLKQAPQFNALMSGRADLLGSVTGVVSSTLGAVVSLMVVLFTGFFLAANPRMYVRGVVHVVPPARRQRMAEVVGAIGYTLKWWMIGQGVDMVVIGVATAIGLWMLGVPLAMLLGTITALFNFIPNFGPLFGLIPAVLLSIDDPHKVVSVIVLFVVLQNLEGYLLMPAIQNRAVDLPNAVTIIAQVLMGILAGGIGLAMAAPLAASVMVAVKMLYVEDALGDPIETPADHDAHEEVAEVKEATREVARERK